MPALPWGTVMLFHAAGVLRPRFSGTERPGSNLKGKHPARAAVRASSR